MARVTVEDCLDNVENRFQLVLVATKRARQIANGVETYVDMENDKPTVVALREIADGFVDSSILTQSDNPILEALAQESQEPEVDLELSDSDEDSSVKVDGEEKSDSEQKTSQAAVNVMITADESSDDPEPDIAN